MGKSEPKIEKKEDFSLRKLNQFETPVKENIIGGGRKNVSANCNRKKKSENMASLGAIPKVTNCQKNLLRLPKTAPKIEKKEAVYIEKLTPLENPVRENNSGGGIPKVGATLNIENKSENLASLGAIPRVTKCQNSPRLPNFVRREGNVVFENCFEKGGTEFGQLRKEFKVGRRSKEGLEYSTRKPREGVERREKDYRRNSEGGQREEHPKNSENLENRISENLGFRISENLEERNQKEKRGGEDFPKLKKTYYKKLAKSDQKTYHQRKIDFAPKSKLNEKPELELDSGVKNVSLKPRLEDPPLEKSRHRPKISVSRRMKSSGVSGYQQNLYDVTGVDSIVGKMHVDLKRKMSEDEEESSQMYSKRLKRNKI